MTGAWKSLEVTGPGGGEVEPSGAQAYEARAAVMGAGAAKEEAGSGEALEVGGGREDLLPLVVIGASPHEGSRAVGEGDEAEAEILEGGRRKVVVDIAGICALDEAIALIPGGPIAGYRVDPAYLLPEAFLRAFDLSARVLSFQPRIAAKGEAAQEPGEQKTEPDHRPADYSEGFPSQRQFPDTPGRGSKPAFVVFPF